MLGPWYPSVSMLVTASWSITAGPRGAPRDPLPPVPSSVPMCTMTIWEQGCNAPPHPGILIESLVFFI